MHAFPLIPIGILGIMGYHGDTYREFCCSGFEAKGDSRNFLSMRFLINPNGRYMYMRQIVCNSAPLQLRGRFEAQWCGLSDES